MGRVRSPKRRVHDDDFIVGCVRIIVGLSSDYPRIIFESSFYWRKHFREFPLKSSASRFHFAAGAVFGEVGGWLYLLHALEMTFHMWRRSLMTFILRGRRSIWWGWRVTLLAPRIGNERFICDADHWWHSFCVAGAVFGEVRAGLFVTGAALRDILGDSRSAKCCILQYKIVSKMGRVRSPKRRVRDDDFIVGYRRIIVGLSSDYGRIVFLLAEALQGVSDEILSFKISWQAQYLVRLEGDFSCSTHWKWGFICDADHWWHSFCVAGAVFGEVGGWLYLLHALEMSFHMWRRSVMTCRIIDVDADQWHSFCVAGAVFGEVGGWLFVTGAALRDILGDSRDAKCCILQYKIVSKMGRVRSPKRRVRDDDFIVGYVGYRRIMVESSFYWRKHFRDFPRKSWPSRFRGRRSISWGWRVTWLAPHIGNDVSYVTQIIDDVDFVWQVQYLVRLEGDLTCSTHWKWAFICDADHRWHSFCVAGAVFGEVGGRLYLLHALEMSFHMWRRSLMTFILRGRCSIWWSWTVTLVAPRSTE